MHLEVLAAEVTLRGEQHLNVLRRGVEDGGKVAGSHLEGLASGTALKFSCGRKVRDVESSLLAGMIFGAGSLDGRGFSARRRAT